ncbi:MAG: hypothetical protein RBR42_04430 [Desulfomicrobium sp.]|nr:hypothetical protein [Desulfomicrobium sp.]
MQVKTFSGPSTTEVMAQIKAELGPDAIILSSQKHIRQGVPYYEIMAALDAPIPEPSPKKLQSHDGLRELKDEWAVLRKQLMAIVTPQIDLEILNPRQKLVFECLDREGVSQDVLMKLWDTFRRFPDSPILATMANLIHIRPWLETKWTHPIHYLAGPSGCGKSSTLLRLALTMKKKDPQARILVVNADNSQGKGRLYLRHYAELSDLSYRELDTPEQWQALEEDAQDYDLVLVDMPSLPHGLNLDAWLDHLSGGLLPPGQVHVILSPVYSPKQMENFITRLCCKQAASIIWTKLDEACNYGEILNQTKRSGLPASLFSVGPELKNTLVEPRENDIWKLLLRHELPTTQLDSNL